MNKQELIDKLKRDLTAMSEIKGKKWEYDRGYERAIKEHLAMISSLDWPEKPVVPHFVADWLDVCKENLGFSLSSAMSHSTSAMKAQPNKVQGWFNLRDNQETFAKAWLFGYEVEKEQLYTAKLKISDEFLRLDYNGKFGHFRVDEKYISSVAKAYHFTKDNLVKYHIWGNDSYEINEVEE